MTVVPLRPEPGRDRDADREATSPEPFEHAVFDELYWSSDTPVTEIAARFGLSTAQASKLATPQPTEHHCLLCGGPGVLSSRSQRNAHWITCGGCGASVRQGDGQRLHHHLERRDEASEWLHSIPRVAVAVVRETRSGDRAELGLLAHDAVDALANHGYPFPPGERVRTVGPLAGLDALLAELRAASPTPTLVGVPSLRTLGATQTEALAHLFALTAEGWRVASSRDLAIESPIGSSTVRSSFDREIRLRRDGWVDDPVDRDGLTLGDRLINDAVEQDRSC